MYFIPPSFGIPEFIYITPPLSLWAFGATAGIFSIAAILATVVHHIHTRATVVEDADNSYCCEA